MAITANDLHSLRKKIEEDKKKLAEQENALKVLEAMVVHGGAAVPDSTDQTSLFDSSGMINLDELAVNKPEKKGRGLTEDIRDLLPKFGKQEFTVAHVEAVLKQIGKPVGGKTPRARIAMALNDLEEAQTIKRTYRGRGSEPHKFKYDSLV
jgi:hypothetical protein